jgi:ATP-dependent Lhr-like helicase
LARIHRLTLDGLRRRIQPVDSAQFGRFLLDRHCANNHAASGDWAGGDRRKLRQAITLLEGFEASAGAWEHDILPARVAAYDPAWLDELFASGEVIWGRLQPPPRDETRRGQVLTRATPISLLRRGDLSWVLPGERAVWTDSARWDAQAVYEALKTHGALFADDLRKVTQLLPSQLDEALRE